MSDKHVIRTTLISTVAAMLLLAAPAAARPTIDVNNAAAAASSELLEYVTTYNADADDYNTALAEMEPDELAATGWEPDSKIVRWAIDGCDRETNYRALCDWSVVFADGTEDEDIYEVLVTRKGHYIIR
jgi:glutamine cyclotransferase